MRLRLLMSARGHGCYVSRDYPRKVLQGVGGNWKYYSKTVVNYFYLLLSFRGWSVVLMVASCRRDGTDGNGGWRNLQLSEGRERKKDPFGGKTPPGGVMEIP